MSSVKTSPRSGEDRLVILLPDPRLLRPIARSVLVAAVIFSFIWLRCLVRPDGIADAPAANSLAMPSSRWVDDPFFFPMLIRDLRREGLFGSEGRRVFLGDPSGRLPFLKSNGIEPVLQNAGYWAGGGVDERSVDFVIAADGMEDAGFVFVEKSLRIGGILVVRLDSEPERPFRLLPNYRIVYVRRFGSTVVGIKKTAHAVGEENVGVGSARKLLGMRGLRRNVVSELEELLLEPPTENGEVSRKRTKYLPELMDLSLDQYPRRVFVDVGLSGQAGSNKWFDNEYPKQNSEFETVRLNVEGKERVFGNVGGISEWLWRNVRKEDFVVMKAEAEEVEVMMEDKTIGLVDELFLECENERQKGMRTGRAYWQCLALNGKLRDEGVAVHQWWG